MGKDAFAYFLLLKEIQQHFVPNAEGQWRTHQPHSVQTSNPANWHLKRIRCRQPAALAGRILTSHLR